MKQTDKIQATTFCSGIHIKQKLPEVPGVASQARPRPHQGVRSRDLPKVGHTGVRLRKVAKGSDGLTLTEPALRGGDDETRYAMTPGSVLSRKSREQTPAEASRRGGQRGQVGKKHHGFFDPRTLNRSVDALPADPGVTVYRSALYPESKLRTSSLEKVQVRNPRIQLSPEKLEKLNQHFMDKSYNWRLKD